MDEKTLKRCYYKEALRYHPDKNSSPESHKKFLDISDAYECARKYHGFIDDDGEDEVKEEESIVPNMSIFANYTSAVFSFLSPLMENETFQDIKTKTVISIIENISNKCESKAVELLERLNRKQCGKICKLLRAQADVLHIPASFMEKMEQLYVDKVERKDECIRIYPTLNDLFVDNVYKLEENDKTYYIPLWHHELVYDNAGAELYVQCIPKLDDDTEIDDKNDIHITRRYTSDEIWGMSEIVIQCGEKSLRIPMEQLKLKRQQTIKLSGMGISRINTSNIYDVSKKSSIHVHVYIGQ